MDNHESHLSRDLRRGVHAPALPPHTSEKLQPLDVGIFSPFNPNYNAVMKSWMLQHPRKPD